MRPETRRRSLIVATLCLVLLGGVAAAPAMAASSWAIHQQHCFPRKYEEHRYIDACWYKYRLTNDGTAVYDYYQFEFFATAGRWTTFGEIVGISLGSSPLSTWAPQTWVDWKPRSDWSGGSCQTINVGISYAGAGLTTNFQQCPDKWDMTKTTTPGKYSIAWLNPLGTSADRELAYSIVVRVPQGRVPGYSLTYTTA
jgi:hypothetical protein